MNCLINLLFFILPVLTNASFRIIGGDYIDITKVPYQVYLYNRVESTFCGGAIINKKTIITAAHCVENITSPSQMSVRVGSKYRGNGTYYEPMRVVSHPNYTRKHFKNDIAIIVLEKNLIFSTSVQPVNLPKRGDELKEGTVGIVSGWGRTTRDGSSSILLKYARLKTISQKNCVDYLKKRNSKWEGVANSFICTVPEDDEKDERSCKGDSGGPFVIKNNTVAGLVSYGFHCGENNTPTVYTYVAYYLDFIEIYSI